MIEPRKKPHQVWMPGMFIPDKALPFIPQSRQSNEHIAERESYAVIKRAMSSAYWAQQKQGNK